MLKDLSDLFQVSSSDGGHAWFCSESPRLPAPVFVALQVRNRGDNWETPNAVKNDDGGLSAPLMYASLVLGMITVWKKDRTMPVHWTEQVRGKGKAGE